MVIAEKRSKGMYVRDIAFDLGVDERTVRRALSRGGPPPGRRPSARRSKLDPFKAEVDRLLSEGVWNAVVIFREIQARGYDGGPSILRDYVRPKRALRKSRETVRFETEPGVQMQNDWGEVWTVVAGEKTKVHFSVNTLGFSRRFHFWSTTSQDAEHTYEGMIRAFEYFGGVVEEVLVDNQKATVISHRIGQKVRFHDGFLDLADHYGFRPRACRPYRARTKGKDERMVGYIKHHFFVRYRAFDSFEHLNQLGEQWLAKEADPRVHGTVREVVAERFAREAPHLHPLPDLRFDTSYRRKYVAWWDGYVDIEGNRYSVPDSLCGKTITARISLDGLIAIFDGDDHKVAEHWKKPTDQGWATVPGHHQRLWSEALMVEKRDLGVYEQVSQCS